MYRTKKIQHQIQVPIYSAILHISTRGKRKETNRIEPEQGHPESRRINKLID